MSEEQPDGQPHEHATSDAMDRRAFLRSATLFTGTVAGLGGGLVLLSRRRPVAEPTPPAPVVAAAPRPLGPYDTSEPVTPWRNATTYNNYYEFGLGKDDPARRAGALRTRPWTVVVDGLVRRPQRFDVETLARTFTAQERVYRMRCVEAWSMVMPWSGFELGELIRLVEPMSAARYVAFTALHDPEQMPGQLSSVLPWPYVEGLRLDEALHPLTILATGLHGQPLPNQNGAPLRLVVPWKYGFKNIKAVARITFTRERPPTTWSLAAPDEYGFYANVNPDVDHPRWSQATERRIGDFGRRPTLAFNGYAQQVAHLYSGMDLRRNF